MSDSDRLPLLTAGVDEVGRGALFGPVVAAAVILTPEQAQTLKAEGVKDSKALSERRREELAIAIRETALTWGLGWAHAREIDRLNILQATFVAMHRALSRLVPAPEHCLVDGNKTIPQVQLPQTALVKGDSRSVAIASASILAKVHRDRWIVALSQRYPGYSLASNKGYGSAAHRKALQALGPTPEHRLSFAPCQPQLLPPEVSDLNSPSLKSD
ncbi:ribonuclease HII [Synechococcus sp. PCC 7336]|uniref:ribonuclease HII n=1 Tax=Synechococcus sp. PCC 7336 TaxID=195250 RepID=UPI00034B3EB3|nr:ribonuclease HII [Synechococcus sp. PCC 7336]